MPRITVPLYADEDYENIVDARRKLEQAKSAERLAQSGGTARAGDDNETVAETRAEYEAVVAAAAERAEMWVLHSIGHVEFRDMLRDHAPRKVTDAEGVEAIHPEDAAFGVNTETFGKVLLEYVDPDDDEIRTIVEPEFATDKDRRRRLKRLSAGEFDTLWTRAWGLNVSAVRDPKHEAP